MNLNVLSLWVQAYDSLEDDQEIWDASKNRMNQDYADVFVYKSGE